MGSPFRLVRVDLGAAKARIPVSEFGSGTGKRFLVTAGMDGDEYAGIEAAYALAQRLDTEEIQGRVTVIPIVNVPGFESETSANPLDGRLPKAFFPGKATGTPTERLVDWLARTYALQADAWLDLHDGAFAERLRPFVWTWETGAAAADAFTAACLAKLPCERFVREKAARGSKPSRLAEVGCAYVLSESGERGRRDPEAIARHLCVAEGIMAILGLSRTPTPDPRPLTPRTFRRLSYLSAPADGLWRPVPLSGTLRKGDLLGHAVSVDGKARPLRSPATGVPLWWKETMRMRKGEVLCAIGVE
ncbi:hypothetical protein EPO34_03965 [Patescibacteria group bacterium]|nr:MAG: hypothetical protein EPO34_03965 [Patescibacteria group bacterium]